jgi:hypothetical protein
MLGTAKAIPDLRVIPDTTNVIEEINRQSLQVASLVDEYTKLSRAGNSVSLLLDQVKSNDGLFVVRTVRIQGDLKSRIVKCRDRWVVLMAKLSRRIDVDTNTRVQKIEDGMDKTGTFYLFDDGLFLIHSRWE